MSDFYFNISWRDDQAESVVIYGPDNMHFVVTAGHSNFQKVLEMVRDRDVMFADLEEHLSLAKAVAREFEKISERVSIAFGCVYFDGDLVDSSLTKAIATFFVEGHRDKCDTLVRFMEKVYQNPQEHSRVQLFDWMNRHNFSIAPDGDIVAYKGVHHNDADTDAWLSDRKGHAVVNGKVFNGRIPNTPGAIVEMPRSEVHHDPSTGCSTGLHVGNWSYARGFAPILIRVKVNPRDVVSVPTDSNWQKVRCCRYQVLGRVPVTEVEDTAALFVPDVYKTLCVSATEAADTAAAEAQAEETPTKPIRKRAAKIAPKRPIRKNDKPVVYYEDMKVADLRAVPFNELRWVAKEWAIKGIPASPTKQLLVDKIARAAAVRRKKAAGDKKFKRTSTKR